MTLTADAQGTALKTLIAMPFVLDGQHCRVEVTAAALQNPDNDRPRRSARVRGNERV